MDSGRIPSPRLGGENCLVPGHYPAQEGLETFLQNLVDVWTLLHTENARLEHSGNGFRIKTRATTLKR